MANDRIKVSTEEMRTCVNAYTASKATLMSAFAICAKATAEIAVSWSGPSFAATAAKMATTWNNLYKAEKKMDDAISELKQIIGIMDSVERENTNIAANLETGESPF